MRRVAGLLFQQDVPEFNVFRHDRIILDNQLAVLVCKMAFLVVQKKGCYQEQDHKNTKKVKQWDTVFEQEEFHQDNKLR